MIKGHSMKPCFINEDEIEHNPIERVGDEILDGMEVDIWGEVAIHKYVFRWWKRIIGADAFSVFTSLLGVAHEFNNAVKKSKSTLAMESGGISVHEVDKSLKTLKKYGFISSFEFNGQSEDVYLVRVSSIPIVPTKQYTKLTEENKAWHNEDLERYIKESEQNG